MMRSLERTGRVGSTDGGDSGGLFGRVIVPFGLRIRLSCLYGLLHGFGDSVWGLVEFNIKRNVNIKEKRNVNFVNEYNDMVDFRNII
jgi:hypothetical protein